ncbi:MAG: hypothetical protein E6R04_08185 [Spirochaetes bacterium]|nr:MAG: hypothetical protein E6R04_08185 [Spirochaetota bacterium]
MSDIAALFVEREGVYSDRRFDVWDISRDAKKYRGPHKVIAHPPCERWGRYWGGGPMLHGTEKQKLLGDDNGCFAHALWCVRTFGGVLEHPEASHAFSFFGLPRPNRLGGWTDSDKYGGRSCCVAQGNYGHRAQKLTWLYGVNITFKDFIWGLCPGKDRLDQGYHSKHERQIMTRNKSRTSTDENLATPIAFRDALIAALNEQGE